MAISTSLSRKILTREKNPEIIQIQSWISSNSISIEKNTIWQVGICDETDIRSIESQIRSDILCKHFKYWMMTDFQDGVHAISHLTKSRDVFKSPLHGYTKKGNYLFTYKTPCPYTQNFHHALRY